MPDRRALLTAPGQTTLNGIDYVEVDSAQTRLVVHFLAVEPGPDVLRPAITAATITGGDAVPTVAVTSRLADGWSTDTAGRPQLALEVAAPGDFSIYTLGLSTSS